MNELTPVKRIAATIKDSIEGWSSPYIRERMKQHYLKLRLIDGNNEWKAKELEDLSDLLLPDDLNEGNLRDFVDRMAELAEINPYLQSFLTQASQRTFGSLTRKVEEEGKEVFSDVVALALAMERLVIAMRDDWKILEACLRIWKIARKEASTRKYMTSMFEHAKLASVEYCIKRFIKYHKKDRVSPKLLKVMLPANIIEAVLEDVHQGYLSNAKAGWRLAVNWPGKGCDMHKGCPATRSEDKKAFLFSMPMPLMWADLYQTWNMTFLMNYPNYPYLWVKLFIPQVAGYQENPEEYIYNRGLALYTYIHSELFDRVDRTNRGEEGIDWRDRGFTQLWGEVNLKSAQEYKAVLKNYPVQNKPPVRQ